MWRALRIFKQFATPQQLRVFSTKPCSLNKECEDPESDIFGNLDESGLKKLESVARVASLKYTIQKRFNKHVECHSSDKEINTNYTTDKPHLLENKNTESDTFGNLDERGLNELESAARPSSFKYDVQSFAKHEENERKNKCATNKQYTTKSHILNVPSFDDKVKTSSSDLRDIVDDGSAKYLSKKIKKERNAIKNVESTFTTFNYDGKIINVPKDDKSFHFEKLEQFTPYIFHKKMERLINEKKEMEAIAVYEVEMVDRDVRPDYRVLGLSIGIYAHMGYTEKAFKLYNTMQKEGLHIENRCITSLFNACANSPWPKSDGLNRAIRLRKQLNNKGFNMNNSQYCAMIKAFGRAGETEEAFEIVDEMLYKGMNIGTVNINFLMQACIENKEAGFRHALMLWKRMRSLKLSPDIFTYNLFLRVIRDCKSGDRNLFEDLLNDANSNKFKAKSKYDREAAQESEVRNFDIPIISDGMKENNDNQLPAELQISSSTGLPDLVSGNETKTQIIGITNIDSGIKRFAFLGGLETFLKNMYADRIKPNEATFGTLLAIIPSNEQAEEALLDTLAVYRVTPNIPLINQLIRKRVKAHRYKSAKDVVSYMQKYTLNPNSETFRYLACTCRNSTSVLSFFKDMESADVPLTRAIVHNLLKTCIKQSMYFSVLEIMRKLMDTDITPDMIILKQLEQTRNNIRNEILAKERENPEKRIPVSNEKRMFLLEYKKYISDSKLHKTEHPWKSTDTKKNPRWIMLKKMNLRNTPVSYESSVCI